MANYELADDEVLTATIIVRNAAGVVVAALPGDVYSVVSSNPTSLGVAIGADAAGAPAVVVTPLVQASPGITVTVSDSGGLTAFVQVIDVVPDVKPTAVGLDLADATLTPQAPPTNPGP